MRVRGLAVVAAVALAVAACGGTSEEGGGPEITTNLMVDPGEVAGLEDGTEAVTQGILVIDVDTRLCELLAESFPPQCAGDSAVIGGLQADTVVALQSPDDPTAEGVKWTTYPLAVVGTVEGGILVNAQVAGSTYHEEGNGLLVRLYTAQTPFFPQQLRSGEAIWWVIDATNVTDEGIPITFGSGQVAEVTVSEGGSELYRWSNGKSFTQEVREVDFEAGRSAGATLADPFAVPPGTDYTLRAWITGIGAEDVVVTAPVVVIQN